MKTGTRNKKINMIKNEGKDDKDKKANYEDKETKETSKIMIRVKRRKI